MKPPAFDYLAPRTVEETVRILASANGGATLLAGGQSLMPLLNHRRVRPSALVDLNGVSGLDAIVLGGGTVRIGALVRLRALETHTALREALPALRETVRLVAYPQIRTRSTLGGSLCQAGPAAELPALTLALDARLCLRSAAHGERTVKIADFYRPTGGTSLLPGELLTQIELPLPAPDDDFRCHYAEVPLAGQAGLPLVGACAALTLDGDGSVAVARLTGAGVGPGPVRLTTAERTLAAAPLTPAAITTAIDAAASEAAPPSDIHGSADYRRALLRTTLRRALERARTG